jgi:hypothetical protein
MPAAGWSAGKEGKEMKREREKERKRVVSERCLWVAAGEWATCRSRVMGDGWRNDDDARGCNLTWIVTRGWTATGGGFGEIHV